MSHVWQDHYVRPASRFKRIPRSRFVHGSRCSVCGYVVRVHPAQARILDEAVRIPDCGDFIAKCIMES